MNRLVMGFHLLLALCASSIVYAQEKHEYAPIEEKTINYADWTFKSLKDGSPINFRTFTQGKKLVLVVYFAPWCPNWRYEAPILQKLYDKYHAHGLEIIAVSEYGAIDETRRFFGDRGSPYPVVIESEAREARDKTTHYAYRQRSGDKRNWGSPYNVFIEPAKVPSQGDILAEKIWVANGELIEDEAERFIRAKLGLEPSSAPTTFGRRNEDDHCAIELNAPAKKP